MPLDINDFSTGGPRFLLMLNSLVGTCLFSLLILELKCCTELTYRRAFGSGEAVFFVGLVFSFGFLMMNLLLLPALEASLGVVLKYL